jgi:hypothetical protein
MKALVGANASHTQSELLSALSKSQNGSVAGYRVNNNIRHNNTIQDMDIN